MYSLFFCIRDQHDLRLVVLAGLICVLAVTAAMVPMRRAMSPQAKGMMRWVLIAGASGGLGVWATHFVAMLGYDPGIGIGYAAGLTFGSLLISVVMSCAGLMLAAHRRTPAGYAFGGVIVGTGIAAMHYMGMAAVEMPGTFQWSAGFVVTSVVFAIVPTMFALKLAIDSHGPHSAAKGGALFALAVLSLHFTGMAGATVVPGGSGFVAAKDLISPLMLALMVAGVTLIVLLLAIFGALVSLQSQAAIAASEREFRILVQGITDCAIYMLSPDGKVTNWNAGAARLKGYSAEEAVGLTVDAFYTREDRAARKPIIALATARETGKFTTEGWRVRKDGSQFWAHVTIERMLDDKGVLCGFAKITRDMSRFKEDQDRLATLSSNLDAALAHMHQGLCLYGADGRLILANARFSELYGLPAGALEPGMTHAHVVRLALSSIYARPISDERLALAFQKHQECVATANGDSITVEYSNGLYVFIAHRPLPDGGWVSTYEDVSERRRSEARIAHMALHDELTGLPNRAHFNERLDHDISLATNAGTRIAVAAIDLDRFKEVNDSWGHAVGDKLLRMLGERLQKDADSREVVARLGGDEFAAYLPYREPQQLDEFLARLEDCLSAPLDLEGNTLSPGASIGVALYPGDGETREHVLNNADLAMYRAKATVGRQVCFYEPGMDEKARERRQLANDLRESIQREELSLAFQVQRSLKTGFITGYEALLRWNHPRHGWIPPMEFIPIAEENGEILRIGEWVLRAACAEAVLWDKPWKVAVNLSPIQLMHIDLVEIVTRTLIETGLSPRRLELEITESAIIGDKVRALHILRSIKALGVTIAIDDFGTGYSSLDTLNSFPFDKIKIDKSFLIESEASPQARAIIRAVLALGRSLDVPVLAEGLQSLEQLELLKSEGCDEAQGYLFGRPQHAIDLGLSDRSDARRPTGNGYANVA